jgi:hypothetical protein
MPSSFDQTLTGVLSTRGQNGSIAYKIISVVYHVSGLYRSFMIQDSMEKSYLKLEDFNISLPHFLLKKCDGKRWNI